MMDRYRSRRRTPTIWNPFREIEQMERMMDETFGRPQIWRRLPEEEYVWSPTIEIYEKENNYIVRMELPGVNSEDVDISMSGDTLTVKGERKLPEEIKDEEYQLCEVCYGSFTRTLTLPEPVNAEKIEAKFENGVLNLRIPKAEEAKPKQIKIQSRASLTQPKMSQEKSEREQEISSQQKSKSSKNQ